MYIEKNADYWDADNVKLNSITMIMVNNANTELSMFDGGELDWAGMPKWELTNKMHYNALKDAGRLQYSSPLQVFTITN